MIKIIKWLSSCFKKKAVLTEKTEKVEKQEITKVMLLSLEYEVKEEGVVVVKHNNFVLPLGNFDMIEEEGCNKLVLNGKGITVPRKKYVKALLSLGNDPKMTWAGDWSDLGTFRLVYKIFSPKVKIEGNKLIIEAKQRDRDLTIPDRTRWLK